MANSTFLRVDATISTRTQIYPASGVVPAGVTAIIFAGTLSNIDSVSKATHTITFEILKSDGTTYINNFPVVPLPYGGVSESPKVVIQAGEKLLGTADASGSGLVVASLSVVERS